MQPVMEEAFMLSAHGSITPFIAYFGLIVFVVLTLFHTP
jgi:hypothetical protein